MTFCQPE